MKKKSRLNDADLKYARILSAQNKVETIRFVNVTTRFIQVGIFAKAISTSASGIALLPALRFSTARAQANATPKEARAIAKEAYIYGFPMVDSYRVQYQYFVDATNPEYKAPWNHLVNTPRVTPGWSRWQEPLAKASIRRSASTRRRKVYPTGHGRCRTSELVR